MTEGASPPAPVPPATARPVDPVGSAPAPSPEAVEAIRKISEQRPGGAFGIQMAVGMPPNPIQQKVNESHITQALNIAATSQSNEFRLGIADRVVQIIVLLIVVGVGIFIIKTFESQSAILVPTLTGFGGFVAGAMSGLGIGRAMGRK